MTENSESTRALLRHLVATLAYRAAKVLRDVPPSFAQFSSGRDTRLPMQILQHLGDLMAWGLRMAANIYGVRREAAIGIRKSGGSLKVFERSINFLLRTLRWAIPPRCSSKVHWRTR